MVRHRWLLAQVVLVGALVSLVLPASSSALQPSYFVKLTSSGPSPVVLHMEIVSYLFFRNTDTVTHSIAFADGSCSAEVAPGKDFSCDSDAHGDVSTFPGYVGAYPYTVDGTTQASVRIFPESRVVTVKAKRHGFRLGSAVRLHGILEADEPGPPGFQGPRMPVSVFARSDRNHPFHLIKIVDARPFKKRYVDHSVWVLWVRPRAHTTYMVKANSQPKGGQFWKNARSRPFGLYVRR